MRWGGGRGCATVRAPSPPSYCCKEAAAKTWQSRAGRPSAPEPPTLPLVPRKRQLPTVSGLNCGFTRMGRVVATWYSVHSTRPGGAGEVSSICGRMGGLPARRRKVREAAAVAGAAGGRAPAAALPLRCHCRSSCRAGSPSMPSTMPWPLSGVCGRQGTCALTCHHTQPAIVAQSRQQRITLSILLSICGNSGMLCSKSRKPRRLAHWERQRRPTPPHHGVVFAVHWQRDVAASHPILEVAFAVRTLIDFLVRAGRICGWAVGAVARRWAREAVCHLCPRPRRGGGGHWLAAAAATAPQMRALEHIHAIKAWAACSLTIHRGAGPVVRPTAAELGRRLGVATLREERDHARQEEQATNEHGKGAHTAIARCQSASLHRR